MASDQQVQALREIIEGFFERLDHFGLEGFRKFYGVYRGFVVDNADPEQRGRVKAYSPDVGQSESNFPNIWIDPAFYSAGENHGSFCPPEIGDCVRLFFSSGDIGNPTLYLGGWHGAPSGTSEVPSELAYSGNGYPERRGFVTRMGHSVVFSDEKDNEEISITWHKATGSDAAQSDRTKSADRSAGDLSKLTFDKDGSIHLENKSHSKVDLDAKAKTISVEDENKNKVLMDSNGITITDKAGNVIKLAGGNCDVTVTGGFSVTGAKADLKTGLVSLGTGAGMSAVLGEMLMTWLAAHVHPTGVGPSGPPAVPPPPTILSQSVKLKP